MDTIMYFNLKQRIKISRGFLSVFFLFVKRLQIGKFLRYSKGLFVIIARLVETINLGRTNI